MSFFSSWFSCCFADSENEKAEADARRARIMNMYTSSSPPNANIPVPPPKYADIANDTAVVCSDIKHTPAPAPEPQYPPEPRRSSISGSSVVSVPSTRLSDLTSMYTSTTRQQRQHHGDVEDHNGSLRSTVGYTSNDSGYGSNDSAPPSYYAGSERSITPVPITFPPAALLGSSHPVLRDGWLDNIRNQIQYERSRTQSDTT